MLKSDSTINLTISRATLFVLSQIAGVFAGQNVPHPSIHGNNSSALVLVCEHASYEFCSVGMGNGTPIVAS